jgi:hypothetical protein
MGTQKNFSENYRQFGHDLSKGFANPTLTNAKTLPYNQHNAAPALKAPDSQTGMKFVAGRKICFSLTSVS